MAALKKILFGLLIASATFSLLYFGFKNEKEPTASLVNGELSLKEALNLGIDKAKEWNKEASFLTITSVDEEMGGSRGEAGKRYKWTARFMVPGTDKHLLVGISNGMITEIKPVVGPKQASTINKDDVIYDSPSLLKTAKSNYKLQPGVDWATGYHFSLSIIDNEPSMIVVGVDKDKQFTKIYFDPRNGKITSAQHKVADGGGLIKLNLVQKSHKVLKQGSAIKGLTTNGSNIVIWGDHTPREFNSLVRPFIEISNNHGETWTELIVNQLFHNVWYANLYELYGSTSNEVWENISNKDKAKRILTLDSPIESIDYSSSNIVALSNHTIYITKDKGEHWEKETETEPVVSVQINDIGEVLLVTNEKKIIRKSNGKWNEMKIPENSNLIEATLLKEQLFVLTDNSLLIYDLRKNTWQKIPMEEQINRLLKNGNALYAISSEGNVLLIKYGGANSSGWITDKVFKVEQGIVSNLFIHKNELIIATSPVYDWDILK